MIKTDSEIKRKDNGDGFDIKMEFIPVEPLSFFDIIELERLKQITEELKNETP